MSCYADKFVITKGQDNEFVFTIKQNGSTLPMEITIPDDTFEASLVALANQTVVLTKTLDVDDALSGRVKFVVTALETESMEAERGSKVDRYYLKPVYKLVIACNTVNNGNFLAKICEVYVD